jgi:CRISPR-associated protein Cas5h
MKEAIVFDIWGDYGYFRRGYTTTSTLTYPFPSRTTLAGIISGILGYERDSYHDLFKSSNSAFALEINNPLKKIRMNLNVINTKNSLLLSGNKEPRSQIPAEFLKDVNYRIYLWLENSEIIDDLYDLLANHKSIYTPYLGISECLANISLVNDGMFDLEKQKVTDGEAKIGSIVPKDSVKIKIEPGKKYGLVKSPAFMNSERIVEGFKEFYYEEEGKEIVIVDGEYYSVGDSNVIFF